MKQNFKQWAWRTLLTLTCILTTTSAWADVTIYVNPSSANYYMHYWGTGITGTTWPGVQFSSDNFSRETIGTINWYKITFSGVNSVNCIFNQGSDQNKTSDITNISGTKFYTYNGGSSYSDVTSTYSPYLDNYYATGDNATVFGTAWSPTAKLMTNDYNGNWTWTSDEFQMNEGSTIGFKVVKNGTDWIPSGEGNETKKTAPATGTYKLKVTYVLGASASDGELIPIDVALSAPVFSLASGTYDTNKEVTITTAGTGTIYYTTDGTDPETSETRIEYNGAISIDGEGEHVIKAVAFRDGEYSDVVTAEYVIKYQNIYLFGSVGKAQAWNYSYTDPELITSDGISYSGVYNVNVMSDYHRSDGKQVGLFLLTTGFGTDWNTTKPYMIGTTSTGNQDHYWIDGGSGHYGEELYTRAGSENGWTLPAGTYEFFYNRNTGILRVEIFDGPTIYVYDYTRPYIYVEDNSGTPFDGVQPGNPIQTLDENVGGHSGLSSTANGSGLGTGTLGWYKFAVPVHPSNCPSINFQFHHNGDKKVIDSDMYTMTLSQATEAYYYWDGAAYQPIAKADVNNLRRIVAHVRVQGTTVPTCDGVAMNGPSSFYGQMYYWMAVTKNNEVANVVITDGTHHYENSLESDVYLEWTENSDGYNVLEKTTLESRLATKTGRGTVIHLLKNKNTPTSLTVGDNSYFLGIDTKVEATSGDLNNDGYVNTTNLGATWWGNTIAGYNGSKGIYQQVDGLTEEANMNPNFSNSQYLANDDNAPVYTITAENGTEWYTWYSDRSVATIKFGFGSLTGNTQYPTYSPQENIYSFFANYESQQIEQQAGEIWYVWTPNLESSLTNGQAKENGTLLDVTRSYESRAKQKALCSTFRDGNYVYYTDIKGWGDGNVYCYVWDKNGNPITPWPGVKMTKVGYDDEGHPVYLADLSNYDVTNAGNVLFNNGVTDSHATNKRQTGDLEWANGGCYDYLGLLYRIGGNTDVIDNEPDGYPTTMKLHGVWYSRVKGTLFAKGDNDYNNKSENGFGYIDFAKTVNDGNKDGSVLQSRDYDQSNWVEISPSEDGLIDADKLISLIGKKFTLYGTKTNSVNPAFTAISVSNEIPVEEEYVPNHFTPIHFNGSPYQYRTGKNEWYFFVEPKPNEFAEIDWTIYHLDTSTGIDTFSSPSNSGFTASFTVDWSYHDPYNENTYEYEALTEGQFKNCGVAPELQDGGYNPWFAIIKYVQDEGATSGDEETTPKAKLQANDATAGKYVVCPIYLKSDMITAIDNINVDKRGDMRSLKSTRYYNLMGVESATPFEGVNIIVKEYSDGSRESSKAIMR